MPLPCTPDSLISVAEASRSRSRCPPGDWKHHVRAIEEESAHRTPDVDRRGRGAAERTRTHGDGTVPVRSRNRLTCSPRLSRSLIAAQARGSARCCGTCCRAPPGSLSSLSSVDVMRRSAIYHRMQSLPAATRRARRRGTRRSRMICGGRNRDTRWDGFRAHGRGGCMRARGCTGC